MENGGSGLASEVATLAPVDTLFAYLWSSDQKLVNVPEEGDRREGEEV